MPPSPSSPSTSRAGRGRCSDVKRRQRIGRIELGDEEEGANLVLALMKMALWRLPVRLFGAPVFGLAEQAIDTEHDLSDVVGKWCDGIDDDPIVIDLYAPRPVEPVYRLCGHPPGENRVATNLHSQARVARAICATADAGMKDVTNCDLFERGFAV